MDDSFFKKIGQDLLTLEINTIIKSDMLATKMPSSRRQALYELSGIYSSKLKEFGVREPVYWEYAGMRSFGELRDRANEGIFKFRERLQKASQDKQKLLEQIPILERIHDQSSQVVGMFKYLDETSKKREGYGKAPDKYLFSWDEIPGKDDDRLIEFLKQDLGVNWVKTAKIKKAENGMTIKVSTEKNSISLRLNGEKTKMTLEIDDGRTQECRVIMDDGKLNISTIEPAKPHTVSELWNNDIDRQRMNEIKDLDITPDYVIMIRKAWDIGTEKIVLQTVIQLDGDVTTRISESFFAMPSSETILKIHNDSIVTSTRFWSDLVGAFTKIASDVSKILLGK